MSHEIDQSTGKAAMAYVGQEPWHGLGQKLPPDADLATWRLAAGMNFHVDECPVFYKWDGKFYESLKKKSLVRSDNGFELAQVGKKYNVVQPGQILEFYRDLVGPVGFKLDTAGVLFNGQKYWALARTSDEGNLFGKDKLVGYLLLVTACDGSMKTEGRFCAERVVCKNTLQIALGENSGHSVKVSHRSVFNPVEMKLELGLFNEGWVSFMTQAKRLAETPVDEQFAFQFVADALGATVNEEQQVNSEIHGKIMALFNGAGVGAEMKTAKGTAWGLLNAFTEFYDHHVETKTLDARLNNAWFGYGAKVKDKVYQQLTALA